jgi:hypothetical protein
MQRFKPNDKRPSRGFRPARQKRGLQSIQIGDSFKRDLILEGDRVYCGNIRQLHEGQRSGKITESEGKAIHGWLVLSSLRRNHVSATEAKRLASA